MSVALPSENAARYLAAVGACAVYVAEPRHIGIGIAPQLRRLPRDVCLQWIAWARQTADVQRLAQASDRLLWLQRGDVRVLRSIPEIVAAIEQHARDLGVVLTSHDRACQRAAELAERVDAIMDSFRQDGQLKAFNASYRAHRLKHNGSAPTYHQALNELRAELIRAVVEAPRGELPVAMLSQRIRQRFPWYVV